LRVIVEDEIQEKGKKLALEGALAMSDLLAQALATGALTRSQLFDTDYVEIPATMPPKYHTAYDAYTDLHIQQPLDGYLESDDQIFFAVLVDRNGYLPTHNTKYSKPLTGDPAKDKVGNRTKRLFDDPVGLAAARSLQPVLVQSYNRDTGEKMWDISAPVYVDGEHWGAFRVGYSM
jgi:hypothetical protein